MIKKPSIRRLEALNGQQGFTLVEVMIAIAIVAIGMLSVAAMQVYSTNKTTSANRSTRGFVWCSDRIEILKNLPYTDANLVGAPSPGVTYTPAQDADGIDNDRDGQIDETGESGDITLTWTVVDNAVVPNTKTITVSVTWQRPLRQQGRIALTTVRARNVL